uniref:Tripartite tricarboxylate transporter TctB family protein n=1 Tax=Bosea sp. NBC_00436 TaxID=2969620 RepID=A0A9E7ZHN0_9HYPH
MTLKVRNQPDFFAGTLFVACGAAFALAARHYDAGTAAQMGPGRFPLILGGVLVLLGLVIAGRSLSVRTARETVAAMSFKTALLVLGSVALFGLLLAPLGLVLASVVLIVVSALASHEFHWRYVTVTAVVLITVCWAIFVFGLGLPLPVLPGSL